MVYNISDITFFSVEFYIFNLCVIINVSGMFYSTPPRPIQITNVPPGQQNPPVANMSNAQSSHGLVVQSQPMEMAANTQPLQVPQQPSTAPMQIPEVTRPRRKTAAIKIINPDTGNEVIVISNNTNNSFHVPSTVSYYLFSSK